MPNDTQWRNLIIPRSQSITGRDRAADSLRACGPESHVIPAPLCHWRLNRLETMARQMGRQGLAGPGQVPEDYFWGVVWDAYRTVF